MKIIGAFSRSEIENIIEPRKSRKSVLISITSPNNSHPVPKGDYDAVLRLTFDDEDVDNEKATMMSLDDAYSIIDFALTNVDKDIFVNCDAGLSRSPAVVVALEELFNSNDIKSRYPLFNRFVYKRIKDCWFYVCWGIK